MAKNQFKKKLGKFITKSKFEQRFDLADSDYQRKLDLILDPSKKEGHDSIVLSA